MHDLFPKMLLPQKLTYEFLGTFARFEYALKESGFAKGSAASVEPTWDAFATSIDWHFRRVADPDFKAAVEFLLNEPPRKQVLLGVAIVWKESPPRRTLPKAQQVLLMVRRVRNNLFHGAKVWSTEYGNRDRDIKLVEASLTVLKHCTLLNARVHEAFGLGAF